MFSLRHLSISRKLWLLTLLITLGLIATTLLALKEYHEDLMQEKELQTRALVETAISIMANFESLAKAGVMTREEAQKRTQEIIQSLRYNETNYFWINDLDARMVMHPIKPQLNGKDMSTFTDPDGKRIFSVFARVAKENGEGVVPYLWPKPGSEEPVSKISYIKGYIPWGWAIGTGVYVDDVEAAFWSHAINLGILALVVLGLLLGLATAITRSIVKPINRTTLALDDIASGEGDLTRRLNEEGKDEIAKLSIAFNRFSEKVQQIITR
jgi:methyl-accepting chemotaxis protein